MSTPLLILGLLVGQTPADEPSVAAEVEISEEIEEVEEVGDLDDLEEANEAAAVAQDRSLLGYFHPALVHFPIAWMVLLLLVEGAVHFLARKELARAGYYLAVLSVASFIPAGLSGFFRFWDLGAMGSDMATGAVHRNLAIAGAALALVIAAMRHFLGRDGFEKNFRAPYLALVLAANGVIGATGHWGGLQVYGPPPF